MNKKAKTKNKTKPKKPSVSVRLEALEHAMQKAYEILEYHHHLFVRAAEGMQQESKKETEELEDLGVLKKEEQ